MLIICKDVLFGTDLYESITLMLKYFSRTERKHHRIIGVLRSVCLRCNGACHWLRGKGGAAPHALSQEVSGGLIHVRFFSPNE